MNKSFKDFMADNEILFAELAFDKNSTLADVACEHHQSYLESIEDRDND
jgi:hypothetical protein